MESKLSFDFKTNQKNSILWLLFAFVLMGFTNEKRISVKEENSELPEKIRIHYHLGYDWRGTINQKEIRGGKVRNEKITYRLSKNKQRYIADYLFVENDIMEFKDGEFGENLLEDCCKTQNINKSFSASKIQYLVDNLCDDYQQNEENGSRSEFNINRPYLVEELELKMFDLTEDKLFSLYDQFVGKTDSLTSSEINRIFLDELIECNSAIVMSSVTEWISIGFRYKDEDYQLSQSTLVEGNIRWEMRKNNQSYKYGFVSPKINDEIAYMLPKKMFAKKRLQFYKSEKGIMKFLIDSFGQSMEAEERYWMKYEKRKK
ncbi:MAG: hypothetical protein R3E32_14105 [Chitinophagales bacterium]